jgi:hypothetical protein
LANTTVDTSEWFLLGLLVGDGINGNGRLAGLMITD